MKFIAVMRSKQTCKGNVFSWFVNKTSGLKSPSEQIVLLLPQAAMGIYIENYYVLVVDLI